MSFSTSRSAARLARQAARPCRSQSAASLHRPVASFSTSASRPSEEEQFENHPRWARTPERMKAPFSPHITKVPSRSFWVVNDDPQKLDEALNNFLGHNGERILSDELKWLAVTHKSFDQGRRGFNDRLAFLGRQICVLECTQSIITSKPIPEELGHDPFAGRRKPFKDHALRSIENLSHSQPNDIFSLEKLSRIAFDTGLVDVPENIKGSGLDVVMSGAVYALVGAVALQQGGKIASRIVRERIMKKIRF
ncbi:hypothetical protein AAE478_004487 [Parahypoxylon ruwenzoriense]